jgi:DNA-binding SARP family transcriptional activator/DNA-binding beta-propeller fold protein YncE
MEFRILGPLEVVEDGRPVSIRRGKEQALLAYLLLHANEVVPSGRLIDALWDERPPPTASKILQNAVSHLRKELGDGRLLTRDPGYLLRVEEGELDLQRFEQLAREGRGEEALTLWRGPALLNLRDERFADDARRRLEDQRLAVLEDRIEHDLAEGRHAELVAELERLVEEDPLRERLQGQLMRALYGTGRQGDALDVFRRARRTLSEELGLEPGPQLQELERKILNQDPELASTAPSPQMRSQPAGRRANGRLALIVLLGALLLAAAIFGIVRATGGEGGPILATKNSLAVIDPHSDRVVKVIPIGATPRGVTVGTHSVWTANAGEGTVSEIDPKKLRVVQTIGLGLAATDLVEASGEVWVATGSDNNIVRIDARSGGILARAKISRDQFASAYAIAAGANAVWVGSGSDIFKIDPSSHELVGRWPYGGGINDVAVGGGSVWLVSSAETVARVSGTTVRPTGEASIGVIPTALAIGGGSIWVAAPAPYGSHAAVWRFDPITARVTQTTTLGKVVGYPPTLEIAFGEGALWVASYDAGTVTRLDPVTGNLVATIRIGGHPSGIAVGAKRIWVTVS